MAVVAPPPSPGASASPRRHHYYVFTMDKCPTPDEIILSLANGIGIEAVDPELFPYIYNGLWRSLAFYEKNHNTSCYKQIKNALHFIQSRRKKAERLENNRRERCAGINFPCGSEEDTINALKQGSINEILDEKVEEVLECDIKQLILLADSDDNFKEANELRTALSNLIILREDRIQLEVHHEMNKEAAEQLADAHQDLRQLRTKWDMAIKKCDQTRNAELRALDEQYETQMQFFRGQLASDRSPRFRAPPQVAELRSDARYLESRRRFSEAAARQREADELETSARERQAEEFRSKTAARRDAADREYRTKRQMKLGFFRRQRQRLAERAKAEIFRAEEQIRALTADSERIDSEAPLSPRLPSLRPPPSPRF